MLYNKNVKRFGFLLLCCFVFVQFNIHGMKNNKCVQTWDKQNFLLLMNEIGVTPLELYNLYRLKEKSLKDDCKVVRINEIRNFCELHGIDGEVQCKLMECVVNDYLTTIVFTADEQRKMLSLLNKIEPNPRCVLDETRLPDGFDKYKINYKNIFMIDVETNKEILHFIPNPGVDPITLTYRDKKLAIMIYLMKKTKLVQNDVVCQNVTSESRKKKSLKKRLRGWQRIEPQDDKNALPNQLVIKVKSECVISSEPNQVMMKIKSERVVCSESVKRHLHLLSQVD